VITINISVGPQKIQSCLEILLVTQRPDSYLKSHSTVGNLAKMGGGIAIKC